MRSGRIVQFQHSRLLNNRITSIKVSGGAKIKLCQNPGYMGFCNTFSSNVPQLGFPLNNKASSYKTW